MNEQNISEDPNALPQGPSGDSEQGGAADLQNAAEQGTPPTADGATAAPRDQTTQKEQATNDAGSYPRAEFNKLTRAPGTGLNAESNLDIILDIPVTISLEIGRAKLSIRNLLQLNQGSVVELDRLAGEPLDVMVNGTLIAHGEVVMVNEKFGIRLTDVVSPAERVQNLR